MSIKELLPSPGQVIKLAVGLVAVFAIASVLGVTTWIIDPVSAWKNRGQS